MAQPTKRKGATTPELKTVDDAALLRLAKKDNRAAYHELFVRHLPGLERYVRREVRYLESLNHIETGLVDPRAVIDQVYIAALENLPRLPAQASFRGWLRYLAGRILRQHVRQEHEAEPIGPALELTVRTARDEDSELWEYYQPDDVLSVEDLVHDERAQDPQQAVELAETEQEIQQELDRLAPPLREAFVLRVLEGLTIQEIAALQHRPPEVVRQAVHDARESLKKSGVALNRLKSAGSAGDGQRKA